MEAPEDIFPGGEIVFPFAIEGYQVLCGVPYAVFVVVCRGFLMGFFRKAHRQGLLAVVVIVVLGDLGGIVVILLIAILLGDLHQDFLGLLHSKVVFLVDIFHRGELPGDVLQFVDIVEDFGLLVANELGTAQEGVVVGAEFGGAEGQFGVAEVDVAVVVDFIRVALRGGREGHHREEQYEQNFFHVLQIYYFFVNITISDP